MLNLIGAASDAFTDPKNPWYYITGGIFLALIVVAIVIYIIWEKKHTAKKQDDGKAQDVAENADAHSEEPAAAEEPAVTVQSEKPEETLESSESEKSEEESKDEQAEHSEPVVSEKSEDPTAENEPEKSEEPTAESESEKPEEDPADIEPDDEEEPKDAQEEETDNVDSDEVDPEDKDELNPEKAKPAAKKTTKPKSGTAPAAKKGKAFIDTVISTAAIQPVYNELKNTLLSYPGMKAKLNKDGEDFIFGTDIKASIKLDGKEIKLYLAAEPDDMKSYKGVAADGVLHTAIAVPESSIDNAEKAIVYVMNVAMLTRNTKHKHVDYVKKAIEAKQRAKKK